MVTNNPRLYSYPHEINYWTAGTYVVRKPNWYKWNLLTKFTELKQKMLAQVKEHEDYIKPYKNKKIGNRYYWSQTQSDLYLGWYNQERKFLAKQTSSISVNHQLTRQRHQHLPHRRNLLLFLLFLLFTSDPSKFTDPVPVPISHSPSSTYSFTIGPDSSIPAAFRDPTYSHHSKCKPQHYYHSPHSSNKICSHTHPLTSNPDHSSTYIHKNHIPSNSSGNPSSHPDQSTHNIKQPSKKRHISESHSSPTKKKHCIT